MNEEAKTKLECREDVLGFSNQLDRFIIEHAGELSNNELTGVLLHCIIKRTFQGMELANSLSELPPTDMMKLREMIEKELGR